MKVNIKKVVFSSIFCALTSIAAMITIPIGPVPITLANLIVYLSGGILGGFYGAISQILYVVLIFVGFPFTSKFLGGPTYIIGPTGGYIVGYIIMAFIVGVIYKKFCEKKETSKTTEIISFFIGAAVGTVFCYLLGTFWFVIQAAKYNFFSALGVCVLPFIPGDIVKIIIACFLVTKFKNIVKLD